ncbi:MAG: queuosine salvage family protein [Gemmatimonadota bacterium]
MRLRPSPRAAEDRRGSEEGGEPPNAAPSLLDEVRARCADVARRARHVRVEPRRVPGYAAELAQAALAGGRPEVDPDSHHLDRGEETVAFFLTLDAVNFGSGYFPHLRKRPGLSGYFTVATSLKEQFEEHGAFTAEELTRITAEECGRIFGQAGASGPVAELMRLFANALNDLGVWLLDGFGGDFIGPVAAAGGSAERLVERLIEMPYFRDVSRHDGSEVPFYKRAQITAADLHFAFGGEGAGEFTDLDRLTIFADNLVPHVLRVDGLLTYAPALAARVDAEELIPPGSSEEIEIRACALHAVELLVRELDGGSDPVNAMRLDYLLWNRGQGAGYKARPRHRTRTVYY